MVGRILRCYLLRRRACSFHLRAQHPYGCQFGSRFRSHFSDGDWDIFGLDGKFASPVAKGAVGRGYIGVALELLLEIGSDGKRHSLDNWFAFGSASDFASSTFEPANF
jgi:hypothetical protein